MPPESDIPRVRPDADPKAGMLRLVMGLGTGAVDRTPGSYPRIAGLDKPEATSMSTSAERHKFSQRKLEAIDREEKHVVQVMPEQVLPQIPPYVSKVLLEHDYEAERLFRERGQRRNVEYISCGGLVKNEELMGLFRKMLHTLQSVYEYPVDIEFTINIGEDGDFVINLLQCRPLQALNDEDSRGTVSIPEPGEGDRILLETRHASMGISCTKEMDAVVFVDPLAYYRMDYNEKPGVARLIGRINAKLSGNTLLMVPGRVGTSSPELGIPVSFADISGFAAICEIAESRIGYNPELSYGSHIFQDLVEMNILYTAVFEGKTTAAYRPELLQELPNALAALLPDAAVMADVVKVYGFSDKFRSQVPGITPFPFRCMLYHDMESERLQCRFALI